MTAAITSPCPAPDRPTRLVVGCGYLGGRVARRWLAAGARVLGVTRSPERAAALAALGIEPVIGDVAGGDPIWLAGLPRLATVFWAVGFDRHASATPRDVHVHGLGRLLTAWNRNRPSGSRAAARSAARSLYSTTRCTPPDSITTPTRSPGSRLSTTCVLNSASSSRW